MLPETILTDAPCNDLVTFPLGGYYTDPTNKKVWFVDRKANVVWSTKD